MVAGGSLRRARRLRGTMTETERKMWRVLRDRRLEGLKFRRQVPFGPYVLDFVCFRHLLIIELDGPFHTPQRDAARDAWLLARGLRTIRFANDQVWREPDAVIADILAAVAPGYPEVGATPHPTPFGGHLLPQGEKDPGILR
jgi:very-short-patch-repair endonuclease